MKGIAWVKGMAVLPPSTTWSPIELVKAPWTSQVKTHSIIQLPSRCTASQRVQENPSIALLGHSKYKYSQNWPIFSNLGIVTNFMISLLQWACLDWTRRKLQALESAKKPPNKKSAVLSKRSLHQVTILLPAVSKPIKCTLRATALVSVRRPTRKFNAWDQSESNKNKRERDGPSLVFTLLQALLI